MRKFIKGPLKGTNLEIMPSKAAAKLPNGTPIAVTVTKGKLSPTQRLHEEGKLNVHEPQCFTINKETYIGPSIAQEWKILHNGNRPFYRLMEED